MNSRKIPFVLLALGWSVFALADETPVERALGHSLHGEAFDEGPRQHAYLMGHTGKVHLPVTTKSKEAQQFFDQGLGQLHGFWYFEAERSFRQVLFLDPECSMAYWGLAMANVNNEKRAKEFIGKAKDALESTQLTELEKRYLKSQHQYYHGGEKDQKNRLRQLVRDWEEIILDFPEDVEAKAFYAYQMWFNSGKDIPISGNLAVQRIIDEVYEKNPMHPAHHYQIHLWDAEKPARALPSAARCGQTSPGIAHMWHMPGHTYTKEARFHDAIYQQEASARVDHAHMMRDRVLPDQIHNYAHNNGWLVENLGFVGQAREAIVLATNLIELPRLARFQKWGEADVYDPERSSFREGRNRLWAILRDFEMWDEVLRLSEGVFSQTDEPTLQTDYHLYRGTAYLWKREFGQAEQEMEALRGLAESWKKAQEAAGEVAKKKADGEKKEEKEAKKLVEEAKRGYDRGIKSAESYRERLLAQKAVMTERPIEARQKLEKAVGFNALEKARLHAELANWEKALDLMKGELPSKKNGVIFHANAIIFAEKLGLKEDAKRYFEELRKLAATADLKTPPLKRLADLAKELKYPEDWRLPLEKPTDLIERPKLDELGPFRWQPSAAPSWTLTDSKGQTVSQESLRGKNVLLLFFLGHECSPCRRQLQAFAKEEENYRKAGLEILAISSDGPEGVKATTNAGQAFSFPILADPEKKAFRAFRAHDDFEQMALHGAFLIDRQGRVRWQDISYQPFMNASWLREEAGRLFRLDDVEHKLVLTP